MVTAGIVRCNVDENGGVPVEFEKEYASDVCFVCSDRDRLGYPSGDIWVEMSTDPEQPLTACVRGVILGVP